MRDDLHVPLPHSRTVHAAERRHHLRQVRPLHSARSVAASGTAMMPKDRGKTHRRQVAESLIAAFGIAALLGAWGWFVR